MTVPTTTSTVTYIGNGSTTGFTFPFIGVSGTDIEVILTTLSTGAQAVLSPSQYTLVINPIPTNGLWGIGGTVTYPISGSPITSTTTLTITRIVPFVQSISISNQGAFYPQAMEQGLDLIEMQLQQLETSDSFAIRAPQTDISPPSVLPPYASRASKVIGFDSTGLNTVMYSTSTPVYPPTTSTSVTVTHSSSPYTIVAPVNVIFVDASSGGVVIVLPSSAIPSNGIFISRIDSTYANSVTLTTAGGQTVNGGASYNLQFQHQGVTLQNNGSTKWEVFSGIKPITNPLTPEYKSWTNIFDIIDDVSTILNIQANGGPFYLDSYFAAAIALGGTVYFPAGSYHCSNPITMLPGVEFVGAGQGNTIIYINAPTSTDWAMQMLNANGTNSVEGFKLRDIQFQITGSGQGVRWNSVTGGFTDDSSSQAYMLRPRAVNCSFLADGGNPTGLQLNKCFDYLIQSCSFLSCANAIDLEGSDIGTIVNCRTDLTINYDILAHSHGTFGSSLAIRDNDFNNPGVGFVDTTYLDILIDNNHMEIDGGPTRDNLIKVSGDAFITKIHNNRVEGNFPTNWLTVTTDVNRYLVSVKDNSCPSSPASMGPVSYSGQYYFNNSGGRCLVCHSSNTSGDQNFPMNTDAFQFSSPGYYAVVTPSTPGGDFNASTLNPICSANLFQISYNASPSIYFQIGDWTSYGLDANQLIGTVTIELVTAAGAAGLIGSWQVFDNGSSVATGTITHAVANQYYKTTVVTSHAFTGNAQLRLWNADGSANERFFIVSASFKLG